MILSSMKFSELTAYEMQKNRCSFWQSSRSYYQPGSFMEFFAVSNKHFTDNPDEVKWNMQDHVQKHWELPYSLL